MILPIPVNCSDFSTEKGAARAAPFYVLFWFVFCSVFRPVVCSLYFARIIMISLLLAINFAMASGESGAC